MGNGIWGMGDGVKGRGREREEMLGKERGTFERGFGKEGMRQRKVPMFQPPLCDERNGCCKKDPVPK